MRRTVILLIVLLTCAAGVSSRAADYAFETISFPGAAETVVFGINNHGVVVGEYGNIDYTDGVIDPNQGFIFDGENYESVSYPGAFATSLQGINDDGLIVGDYTDEFGNVGAFVYDGETFQEIGTELGSVVTAADINNLGHIVGSYSAASDIEGSFHGFFYNGSEFETIDMPTEFLAGLIPQTLLWGINDDDTIVGIGRYVLLLNKNAEQGGFLYPGFDFVRVRDAFAFVHGINNTGVIAGAVGVQASDDENDTRRRFWGFIQEPGMAAELVRLPGDSACFFDVENVNNPITPDRCLSFIRDINDHSQIVGYFDNNDGIFQGFVGTPLSPLRCDLDDSGVCDAGDIDVLTAAVRDEEYIAAYDLSGDGQLDELDRQSWFSSVGTVAGDADLDGEVNFADFLTLSSNFGMSGGWAQGNFDVDTEIGFPDFLLLSSNFGVAAEGPQPVPEPASKTMMFAWVLMLGVVRSISVRKGQASLDECR